MVAVEWEKKIKNKVSRWLVSFAWFAGGRVGLGGAMQNEKKKGEMEKGEWRMEKTGWVDERESVKSEKESEKVGEKMQGSEIQEEEGGCAKEKKKYNNHQNHEVTILRKIHKAVARRQARTAGRQGWQAGKEGAS